jgi:hypothetical protein
MTNFEQLLNETFESTLVDIPAIQKTRGYALANWKVRFNDALEYTNEAHYQHRLHVAYGFLLKNEMKIDSAACLDPVTEYANTVLSARMPPGYKEIQESVMRDVRKTNAGKSYMVGFAFRGRYPELSRLNVVVTMAHVELFQLSTPLPSCIDLFLRSDVTQEYDKMIPGESAPATLKRSRRTVCLVN